MSSLIADLQRDAANPAVRVSDLLRKAKLVAGKLGLDDFRRWVDSELDGYDGGADVPRYRRVAGSPMWLNPYRGWQLINFGPNAGKDAAFLSNRSATQPIGELENLVARGGDNFHMPYSAEITTQLCKGMGVDPTQAVLQVNQSQLAGILDAVRNALLDWSLKLEAANIVGAGLSFSAEEKSKAHEPQVIYQIGRIDNFLGHMGTNTGIAIVSAIQNPTNLAEDLARLLEELKPHLAGLQLSADERRLVEQEVAALETEGKVSAPDAGKVSSALRTIKGYAGKAADKVISYGIEKLIDAYLK